MLFYYFIFYKAQNRKRWRSPEPNSRTFDSIPKALAFVKKAKSFASSIGFESSKRVTYQLSLHELNEKLSEEIHWQIRKMWNREYLSIVKDAEVLFHSTVKKLGRGMSIIFVSCKYELHAPVWMVDRAARFARFMVKSARNKKTVVRDWDVRSLTIISHMAAAFLYIICAAQRLNMRKHVTYLHKMMSILQPIDEKSGTVVVVPETVRIYGKDVIVAEHEWMKEGYKDKLKESCCRTNDHVQNKSLQYNQEIPQSSELKKYWPKMPRKNKLKIVNLETNNFDTIALKSNNTTNVPLTSEQKLEEKSISGTERVAAVALDDLVVHSKHDQGSIVIATTKHDQSNNYLSEVSRVLVSHCSIELGDNVKAKTLNSQEQGKLEQNVKPDCLQNCNNVPHLKSLPIHKLTEERNQIRSSLEGTDRGLKIKHAISNDTIIVPENVGIVPSKDVTNDMYIQKGKYLSDIFEYEEKKKVNTFNTYYKRISELICFFSFNFI